MAHKMKLSQYTKKTLYNRYNMLIPQWITI